jgi:hypothetical protein
MKRLVKAAKLTVFVGGDERREHRPLYQGVVDIVREHKIAGVTLIKGAMSYSGRELIHSALNEVTMNDLPIIVEAVDIDEKIRAAAEQIAAVLGEHGLVQIQPTIIALRASKQRGET